MDRRHDLVQLGVDLLGRPVELLRVLRHFETRRGHAAGVHGLARSVGNLRRDEGVDGLRAAAHVRNLGHDFHAVGQQPFGVLAVQLVLRGARHGDVHLDLPRFLAREELRAGEFRGVWLHHVVVRRAQFEHVGDLLGVETRRIVDVSVGTRDRHHLGAQFRGLRRRAPGHVAEARDGDGLALDVHAGLFEHLTQEIDGSEARRLGTDQRTAVGHALARQHAGVLLGQLAVHAVEIADFASADADVACRNVGLRTDVTPQFGHKGLAEAHHLTVRLAFGVEIRTALRAAHREGRQRILEDLLETEELQDRGVHRGVEAQSALVGADGVVELHAVARVHLHVALVVDPYDLEREGSVGFHDAFGDAVCLEFRVLVVSILHGHQNFAHGLQVFAFAGVLALEFRHNFVNVHSSIGFWLVCISCSDSIFSQI